MELKKEIESLLFSSGKVMTEEDLAELTQKTKKDVNSALESLKKDYEERDTSLIVVKRGDGWKLNVREKYINLVTKIVADTELPFPLLETLAVIAYKSPAVMQSEVIKARGTNAYDHITQLIESEFIERKKQGRSFKIFLTPKFFEYFDVEGDKDIKEYLKEVQPSESSRHVKKKIGSLDVVDMPEEAKQKQGIAGGTGEEGKEKQNKLGDLEIVDEMPEKDEVDETDDKITIDDVKPDGDFLSEMEKKIDALSKKNDELDQDESFKRQDNEDIFGSDHKNDSEEETEDAEHEERAEEDKEDQTEESNEEKKNKSSKEEEEEIL